MTNAISGALYAVALAMAFASAPPLTRILGNSGRRPIATVAALLVIGLPTAAQFTVAPWLLNQLERDWTQIAAGQVWRLVTSLVVQDGGLPGAAFNPRSRAYAERRTQEGLSKPEIIRCLKRYVAREIYQVLVPAPAAQIRSRTTVGYCVRPAQPSAREMSFPHVGSWCIASKVACRWAGGTR